MSYARWLEDGSAVYVFPSLGGFLVCKECLLLPLTAAYDADYETTSRTDMLAHLREHQAAGHKVPDRAFERLEREIAEEKNGQKKGSLRRCPWTSPG